jgi:cation diffusion facilitator family transporter
MRALKPLNDGLIRIFIPDDPRTDLKSVRIRYGLLAGWASVSATLLLFVVKMYLGLRSHSVSVVANAFHLLSHLANSVVLILSFHITARPATSRNPFGHGRMEQVAPLIMSIFLFVSGIQLAETSLHRTLDPHEVHYWPALIWILFATILIKQFLAQFVLDIGNRVNSHAILTNAHHHRIEAVMSLAVIGGLVAGHYIHLSRMDGALGILVSLWLLYLGFSHGREALVPLLGQAPSRDMIGRIRKTVRAVEGVEGVHEIIVHDYGSNHHISMHVEVPEKLGPAEMHETAERCEALLRKEYGGAVVCHTDPLMEKTPEIQAVEDRFREQVKAMPEILSYHDFRVVAHSDRRIIIIADLNVEDTIPEAEFEHLAAELEQRVIQSVPNVAYCSFYVTPKYAY